MQVFTDETEFTDVRMMQKVVGMFDSLRMQRIVACGLLGVEYDDLDLDHFDSWPHNHNSYHRYQGNSRGLSEGRTRLSSSAYQSSQSYYPAARDHPSPPVKVQAKESDSERKARLLQEARKSKEKAQKKRLKKQKQKQRKQMEKEKQNEGGSAAHPSKEEEGESTNDEKKEDPDSSVTPPAADKDTDGEADSSEQDSSGEEEDDTKDDSAASEELDMTSTFVSKAALIVKRQLEQKPKCEKRRSPEKEKYRAAPDRNHACEEVQTKTSAPSSLTIEDNVKISTELAVMGNKFASEGNYFTAVKYFTDAIKYNPKEFKLFGNRSFCFEKLQDYEKALIDAELSLGISPGWVKGLFRKGRALAGLRRYEEAAQAFRDVLKLDSSYAEAAQELMRVQIIQLMEYGFTREQSSNALIIHGTVNKALEVLSKLNHQSGAPLKSTAPLAQVVNVTGVSPVLSANTSPVSAQSYDAYKTPPASTLLGPVQNIPNIGNQPKPVDAKPTNSDKKPPLELFPVWVGNLTHPVPEPVIKDLFSKAGDVISVKVLSIKRCAFVNFTKPEHCDEAIRRFHGCTLNGMKLAVRYPDRIPPGIGISKSALKAHDLQDENLKQGAGEGKAFGNQKYFRPYQTYQWGKK
uniref:RRM domain-containing protein n=1 Tax=Nothobranchius korthausae TaxID=1143690 RepID=A0A1A8H6D6_9TELE